MTTSPTVRAKVKSWPAPASCSTNEWLATAWISDTDAETGLPINRRHRFADAPSWPEAMQAAQVLRADLERELMDEVHASRASRRTARAVPQPPRAVAFCPCTQCTEIRAQHTDLMEPTA